MRPCKIIKSFFAIIFFLLPTLSSYTFAQKKEAPYIIVIHGGAGNIRKEYISDYDEQLYIQVLDRALETGAQLLENGGNAVDVIVKVLEIMENSPLFNAGRGAAFNSAGNNELEAAIMNGKTHKYGAVAAVTDIKNPIKAAYQVMLYSPYDLLVGKGASAFARRRGLEMVDNSYFFSFDKWNEYLNKRDNTRRNKSKLLDIRGTVGCVIMDKYGNLAAGTSTGGLTYKIPGRVSDSPIAGAGTFADNRSVAVSCSGDAEKILENLVAYDIAALMKYKNWSLQKAVSYQVNTKFKAMNAKLGIIAIDKYGNFYIDFNTYGMFRAYKKQGGKKVIKIYGKH